MKFNSANRGAGWLVAFLYGTLPLGQIETARG
jgi:hypothetical protein